MSRCKDAFEEWYQLGVCMHMDIQTEIAWENWQAAWNAAIASLTAKSEEAAYYKTCSIWLTEATKTREKYAYRDGHHRGWLNAVEHLTPNAQSKPPAESGSA